MPVRGKNRDSSCSSPSPRAGNGRSPRRSSDRRTTPPARPASSAPRTVRRAQPRSTSATAAASPASPPPTIATRGTRTPTRSASERICRTQAVRPRSRIGLAFIAPPAPELASSSLCGRDSRTRCRSTTSGSRSIRARIARYVSPHQPKHPLRRRGRGTARSAGRPRTVRGPLALKLESARRKLRVPTGPSQSIGATPKRASSSCGR